jgi:hypothetical protein
LIFGSAIRKIDFGSIKLIMDKINLMIK